MRKRTRAAAAGLVAAAALASVGYRAGDAAIGDPAVGWTSDGATRSAVVERVIDGDTFVIAGGARVRVKDFDTAELRHWECQAERALARAARDRARELLQGARVRLRVDGEDRYRRLVADVFLESGPGRGETFVEAMTGSGHGARWNYGHEPQPDWCGPDAVAAAVEG